MAVDKNKITADATKLVQKGQWDKAIKAYERILADDPKDVRVLLKVGELQQKKGDNAAAAETFNRVADAYGEQGFFLKAVAVYKQIAKLTPDDARVNERLAALYQQLGLMSDAMAQMQIVATAHEKAGDSARLLDVLRRMVELDPDNIASSIKLGELHAKAGQSGPALEQFRRAADYLKRNNRADEYLKVAERIAYLASDDLALTRELANLYLAKGDTKRALAKLQLCFKANPKDIDTLALLARAFRDLGQISKTVSVFKEMARVYEETGRAADARATYRKVLEIAPDDGDAVAALESPAATPAPAPPRAAEAIPPVPSAGPAEQARGRGPARAPPPRPPAAGSVAATPADSGAHAARHGDSIPKLLTETDVYVKYGLHEKAIEHLGKAFAVDPENPDALEKLRDIYAVTGDASRAADAAARAARACAARGLADRAAAALARLREIAPRHPDLERIATATRGPAPAESTGEAIVIEPEPELGAGDVAPPAPAHADASGDELALAAAEAQGEEVIEDEPLLAPPPARRDAAPPRRPTQAPAKREGPAARPGPAPAARPAARRSTASAGPTASATADAVDLSDEIAEADFYLQQGLRDEAREVLANLLASHPGHRAVEAKLAELSRATTAPPPAKPGPSSVDESFDIARELAQELGEVGSAEAADEEFQYSVEDVFKQFKKGVEKTVRPEDGQTHYDLGIAYKEMGLLDDAIHEFEAALAGRKNEVDCLSMIGLCRATKGELREAVLIYRRALASKDVGPDASKALQYELGVAHEALGDADAALRCFSAIAATDARYRDVAARVQRAGGAVNGAAKPPERPAPGSAPRAGTPAPARPSAKKNIGYL